MSIYAVKSKMTTTQEQVSAARFLGLATELFSVIFFIYDGSKKKLQYSFEQLESELGIAKDVVGNADLFDVFDLIHPEDLPAFLNMLELKADAYPDIDCRLMNGDGAYRHYTIKSRFSGDGNANTLLMAAISSHSPFSVLKQQSKLLKETIDELKHANKELEDFAYIASHDLQEPLRKITTFSTLLSQRHRDALKQDGASYLDRIISSANDMRQFINSLLEFSHISRVKLLFKETDLNEVIGQVRSELDLTIEESKVRIICDLLPVIEASPTQMKQLFTNLIANAIKFRKEGVDPVISITASRPEVWLLKKYKLDTGKQYYRINVEDNGIGFDSEYDMKIFQVFQRLHGKADYPGSGVGLAICKKIVDQHEGVLFAEGKPGKGACFVLILPQRAT